MKKFAVVLMLSLGVSACTLVPIDSKKDGSVAENSQSDCGTIVMLRGARIKEGFSRDLDCRRGNVENVLPGQECFQYTILLDHGGSFMIAQPRVPSLTLGKRVCIVPGATGRTEIMKAE